MRASKWAELFGSEWDYVQKLGRCFLDEDAKRGFWDTVREKKLASQAYSIYDDFPPGSNAAKLADKYAPLCKNALANGKADNPK